MIRTKNDYKTKFRYFVDAEGYSFILINNDGGGLIFNPDGKYEGEIDSSRNIPLKDALSEINPEYFTADFMGKFVEMNKDLIDRKLLDEIYSDVENLQLAHHDAEIPNSAAIFAVKQRIEYLNDMISKYKSDNKGRKFIEREIKELTEFLHKIS